MDVTTYRFSASRSPQQLGPNWGKYAVTVEFCSISTEKLRNDSPQENAFAKVCQAKHQQVHGTGIRQRQRLGARLH